jgi:hypothetical protein
MANKGVFVFELVLLVLVIADCDGTYDPNRFKRVDYNMHGAWECMEEAYWPEDYYPWKKKGKIVLDYDTITITGPVAHLEDFTRGIALEAYTESTEDRKTGLLYIKDRGLWQSPISYRRWQSGGSLKIEMLTLTDGILAEETLQQIPE